MSEKNEPDILTYSMGEKEKEKKKEPFIFYMELNCAIQVDIDIAIDILTLLQEAKTKQCDL